MEKKNLKKDNTYDVKKARSKRYECPVEHTRLAW